jgi:putative transposase
MTQVEAVLDSMVVVSFEAEQHLCADKGYDSDSVRSALSASGYVTHILSRGDEMLALKMPGYRARRWVVEAAHSWLNRFRRLLIRWEKNVENYAALFHLACAVIVWRRCPLSADDYLFG